MSNREIDELLYNLRKRMDKGIENKELSIILSNESIYKIIKEEFQIESDKMVDDILKKILTDFYAYYLYKLELDDNIDENIVVILNDFNELSSEEDVISYIRSNKYRFKLIIDGYFEYHKNSIMFQSEVMANVVNMRKGIDFTSLYNDFFAVDIDYESLLLPHNVIVGLELLDNYKESLYDDKSIINYLNIEFDKKKDKYDFLNYILSNIYANIKLNGCKNDEDNNTVKLVEHLDKNMRCFYDDNNYVINLVKKYNDLYKNVKWYEFKDIRDYYPIDNIDIIYKLDNKYKHPQDIIKNANDVYTVVGRLQEFLFKSVENLIDMEKSNEEIVEWLIQLIDGKMQIKYSKNGIFDYNDDDSFIRLIKLYLVSAYYEYCNYTFDNLNFDELDLFEYIDNGIDAFDCLDLYEDDHDKQLIALKYLEYSYCKENTEILARKKIVSDNRFNNAIKMNPYIYLEYRRVFGTLLPLETSKSTEYGNLIIGKIFDIISLFNNLEDEYGIKYEDLAQMFKNESYEIYMDMDEIVGFIFSNIYENLMSKIDITDNEKDFINNLENNFDDVYNIIDDDDSLGRLLLYFFELNSDYFNDYKLKKLKKSSKNIKVKILKKLDPFYEVDSEVLKID